MTIDLQVLSSTISGIIFLGALVRYMVAIRKGYTKPVLASWIIWWSIDFLALASMLKAGVVSYQMIGVVLGAGGVIFCAIKWGDRGRWNMIDYTYMVIGALGAALWAMTDDPILGVVFSQIGIFTASVPTFKAAWSKPENEDRASWMAYLISCVFALLAIKHLTVEDTFQPINFTVIEAMMVYLTWIRPRKK